MNERYDDFGAPVPTRRIHRVRSVDEAPPADAEAVILGAEVFSDADQVRRWVAAHRRSSTKIIWERARTVSGSISDIHVDGLTSEGTGNAEHLALYVLGYIKPKPSRLAKEIEEYLIASQYSDPDGMCTT